MVGIRTGGNRLALVLALACASGAAQTTLSLEQAGARNPSADFAPTHVKRKVLVRGVVNAPAFHFPNHTLLTIEDGDYGGVLKVEAQDTRLDSYRAGDELQVEGIVAAFVGMAVIQPSKISQIAVKPAPTPIEISLQEAMGFRYLGRLVRIAATVDGLGDTANGAYLSLQAPDRFLVFVPRTGNQPAAFRGVEKGNAVNVAGVVYQYCSRPPFNRYFQLLVQDPAYMVPLPNHWIPPPVAVGSAIGIVSVIGFVLWTRERRLRKQRERLRKTYKLGEEILGAPSAETMLKRIGETLPEVLKITGAQMYVHNRTAKTLDSVAKEGQTQASFPLAIPADQPSPAAIWCYQYHSVLAIPAPERSPFTFVKTGGAPKSLLFVPMLAQGEVVGVLEFDRNDRSRAFSAAEQELGQHLANQAAVAIRLLEQRSVQEQLFRTEKLAAVGRLISGVVNELRAPLESIEVLAIRALNKGSSNSAERELSAIADEARKASGMVERLVSYASAEKGDARPVQVGELLRTLIEFREGDWKASGIRARDLTTREPFFVLGSHGQLEQVFLNLLVHAEQSLADAPQKVITVRTSVLAKRLLVEIAFTGRWMSRPSDDTAAVLGVTRSVVAGHGGEVRLIEKNNADPRFEVELPIAAKDRSAPASMVTVGGRPAAPPPGRTALVIENEESAQRQLLSLLSSRGFRVVPVENADAGLDLAHRMRFDAAFCSVHAPGLNWVELSERMNSRVGAFVLVSDHFDAELVADFEGDRRFVLTKPIQEIEVDRVVRAMDPPRPAAQNGAA
jgi:GAF domain-containing protein